VTGTGGSRFSGLLVLLLVARPVELGQQHVVGNLVLRVQLEHRPLKVLHRVGLAVRFALFLNLVRQRVAKLGQATMSLPVAEELARDAFVGLLEADGTGRRGNLVRGSGVLLLIVHPAQLG